QLEVDTAFEIEAELELLLFQPARSRQVLPRGQDRIDPDTGEHNQDGDDGDDFPAYVLHGLCLIRFDDRRLTLVAADRRPRDLDTNLIGNLQLHLVVVDFHDLAVDSARRNHAIV